MTDRKPVAQFTSQRYPYFRVRDLKFNAGILLVYSESDAEMIRGLDDFGVHVHEEPLDSPAHVEPAWGDRARQGTQSTASSRDNEELPSRDESPDVIAKPGGWYEYQGKNYRRAGLPESVRDLV